MDCYRIVYDTERGAKYPRVTAWQILPPGLFEHQTGRRWPMMHELRTEPVDCWLRGEPIALPDRVLYLLSEYQWPQEAVVALADVVYKLTRKLPTDE